MQNRRLEALRKLSLALWLDILTVHDRVCRCVWKDEQLGISDTASQLLVEIYQAGEDIGTKMLVLVVGR